MTTRRWLSVLLLVGGTACSGTVTVDPGRDASADAHSVPPADGALPVPADAATQLPDAGEAGADAAALPGPDSANLPADEAELVAANFPDSMTCGETRSVTLTFKNKGAATWTADLHVLGAVGDSDPFHSSRVTLATGDSVVPEGAHAFTFDLLAPSAAGTFTTDWQMVHEGVAPFGAIASHDVAVTCPIPDGEAVLASASIVNSPTDTPSWTLSTQITQLRLGADGVEIDFGKKDGADRWPDVTPPGWDGPLQYTLWLAMNINGQWFASGIIQYWYGLAASGGDVTVDSQIAKNWVYDGRWGAMEGHQPAPGEFVGFMVSAGNVRGVTDGSQSPVMERSQMVIVPFPASSGAVFTF